MLTGMKILGGNEMNRRMISLFLIVVMLLLVSCNSAANNNVVAVENEIDNTENVVLESEEAVEAEETEEVEEVIEKEDLDNPKLPATLTYIGRATMRIEFADDTVLYIDPYAGTDSDYEVPADLVLVTHQHGDHNQVQKVTLKEEGQVIMCPTDIVEGDTIEINGMEITAVAAYNKNHARAKCCGFIIQVGEMVLYHSGDTSYIPEMEALADYNIDFAFVTMDGVWNMGHVEAKLVAETINAELIMPIHTDGDTEWNLSIAEAFDVENKVIVLPGETLEIK